MAITKRPKISISCEPEIANRFIFFCKDNGIVISRVLRDFINHFLEMEGRVNLKKDFIAEVNHAKNHA